MVHAPPLPPSLPLLAGSQAPLQCLCMAGYYGPACEMTGLEAEIQYITVRSGMPAWLTWVLLIFLLVALALLVCCLLASMLSV